MSGGLSNSLLRHRSISEQLTNLRFGRPAIGTLIIVAACVVIYYPSLSGGYLLDDDVYIAKSSKIVLPGGLSKIWWSTEPEEYYPISNSCFWLQWRVWNGSTTGFRLTSLLLHIVNCVLLWLLLERLGLRAAYFSLLLFAVHPVNVDSVAWIFQQRGLLAMGFFLMSILSFLRDQKNMRDHRDAAREQVSQSTLAGHSVWYWLSLASFLAGMFSKGSIA